MGAVTSQSWLPAVLRSKSRDEDCTLSVWKESSSSGREFTRCRIMNEPSDLPDGPYLLIFEGNEIFTRKWCGTWMLDYLPGWIEIPRREVHLSA
jgi:hypothetical protein